MRIIKKAKTIRAVLTKAKSQKKKIGFVPTMGALHEGHLSLLRRCSRENDISVMSIFVNPLQFGPHENFKNYPREEKNDLLLAKNENIDIIFYPSKKDMYPQCSLTTINVKKITENLCGRSRPNHFRGVTTVVGKLLNIISPTTLYLGQKDAQQCLCIQQMIRDLNYPVAVKVLPIIREKDGLAMSSRNKYLSTHERNEAPVLYQSLCLAKQKILQGARKTSEIIKLIRSTIQKKSSGRIDYIACVDAQTLQPLKYLKGRILIALAIRFRDARLIDNIGVRVIG